MQFLIVWREQTRVLQGSTCDCRRYEFAKVPSSQLGHCIVVLIDVD